MRILTIIFGAAGSGKTTLARRLSDRKETIWLPSDEIGDFYFSSVKPNTEMIILDGVSKMETILFFLTKTQITVERQFYIPFVMEMPDIIIISNEFTAEEFILRPRLNLQVITTNAINFGPFNQLASTF